MMKKTSTRLATIGVLIVLGAFAIALAQHDARNRDREKPEIKQFAQENNSPIAVGEDWASRGGIVRGNNDLPPDPLPQLQLPESDYDSSLPDFSPDEMNTESDGVNPLRAAMADMLERSSELVEQTQGLLQTTDSEVVQAAGERPATQSGPTPPSWLNNEQPGLPSAGTASPDANSPAPPNSDMLPALPTMGTSNLPGLPNLPGAGASLPSAGPSLPTGLPTASSLPTFPQAGTTGQGAQPPATAAGSPPGLPSVAPPPGGFPPGGNQSGMLPPNFSSSNFPPNQDNAPPAAQTSPAAPIGRTASIASRAPNSLAALVSNQPGNRYLDGSQNPVMLIQKRAPEEIQVGKKATFVITVRNAGNATAHKVTVVDSVPRGARFEGASPDITPSAEGLLTWELGEMAAGDERTISLQITPEVQGEVGSVASVHFAAQASVRTVATLPKIEISVEASPEVMIGGAQSVTVTMKNTGTGVARNVRLEADIPPQLKHESGYDQLDAPIGDMRPHEIIQRTLSAAAIAPGQGQVLLRAVSDDGVMAEESVGIDVKAPQLAASITGPKLRYLERQATYQITVVNNGTAAATDLEFVVRLPAGLKYISNSLPNYSNYDPNTHSLTIGLSELPPNTPAKLDVSVLPVDLGSQVITFAANGALNVSAESQFQVQVDGLAELAFTIGQDNGTIETGATSTDSVQVTNIGNKPDKNVQLMVQLPNGTELVEVDAPGVEYRAQGTQLVFAPIAEMRNKDQATFRFEVRHNQAGNQVVRTQLTSENWPVAVVKEEGTLVYNDQN
ncbi:MAG: hypothetical protein R3C53_17895 [Pirellulaceae bacterium]